MSGKNESIFLYWGSGSNPCWRVQITLEEKNIEYEHKLLSFEKNEQRSEENLRFNPRGQLPTLRIGSTTLNESLGSCLYLEDEYKSQGTTLIPNENKTLVFQRMFEALNVEKYCNENIIYHIWATPQDKINQSYLNEKKKELNKELQRWEDYFNQQNLSFLAGESFTMADVIFFPQLAYAVEFGYPMERFPKLKAYYDSLKERKSIQKTWPPHWKTEASSQYLADC